MGFRLKGDKVIKQVLTAKSKSLRINLNNNLYGTFAEIGAGQETVRNFFRAGGASGTIAKAISAYDKVFSDAIYGIEDDGRYVTEKRLTKMLRCEGDLLEQRLEEKRNDYPDRLYFCYANTVATINFTKKFKGHGWVGIRFQTEVGGDYNEVVLHVRFKENEARLQQETLGTLGVNLIYGAFYLNDDPEELLKSFYDNIDKDKIEIDMINFSGPRFEKVDNRLMSLLLVKNGMTNAVMFGPDGKNLLPAQVLYKRNILALRGSFRPVTKVNMEMFKKSQELFFKSNKVDKETTQVIFEINLSNLLADGTIDERDFLDRAELLCSLGQNVMISTHKEYFRLVEYFSEFTKNKRIGLAMGVFNFIEIFNEKYYRDLSGGILEAFGKLFNRDLKVYLYPFKDVETGELITSDNLTVHPRMKDMYKYLKYNRKVVDITNFDPDIMHIFSRKVLKTIREGGKGWEEKLPEGIAKIIKDKNLFKLNKVIETEEV